MFHRALAASAAALSLLAGGAAVAQQKEVTIAHQDMMVPWRYALVQGEIEKATGYKINYRMFGGGGDVIRAMASGQVQIGEAGSAPIASAMSQGLPVDLIWILSDIASAEAMVARNGSGVNSVADLKGKRIGVPFTSTTHFHTMVALEMAKMNPADVRVVNMRPPEIAAVLARIKGSGKVLITSGDITKQTGKATFDGIVVNRDWAKQHGEFLAKFVEIVARADQNYRANTAKWTADSPMVQAVAKISGAKPADIPGGLALYRFIAPAEQVSSTWLGGGKQSGAAASIAATAAFLKAQGTIQATLPDYSLFVNPSFAQRAAATVK
ncbi:MAG: ABC transporter substrate-binding protein [Burkholderiaceae bacterium]|nr:ABC transporter substrate-binding protein [Burkholderiaceae bacterium]